MGYRENEFAAFGVPMDERVGRFEESVEIVRAACGRASRPPITASTSRWTSSRSASRRCSRRARPSGSAPDRTAPVRVGRPDSATRGSSRRTSRPSDLQVLLGHYRDERERSAAARPSDLVVRRELVLDDDPRAGAGDRRRGARRADPQVRRVQRPGSDRQLPAPAVRRRRGRRRPTGPTCSPTRRVPSPRCGSLSRTGLHLRRAAHAVVRPAARAACLQTLKMFRDQVRPAFDGTT